MRIGVGGVGLNEGPITLALMLPEYAGRIGVKDPDFEVRILSERGVCSHSFSRTDSIQFSTTQPTCVPICREFRNLTFSHVFARPLR